MIRTIAGRQNASVKLARRLMKKKYRLERRLYPAEGLDILEAGLAAGRVPKEILVREGLEERVSALLGPLLSRVDVGVCAADLLATASSLGGAADVVTIFPEQRAALGDLDFGSDLLLYLFEVGDPGNVGTLVRSAVVFGASGVALSPASADPFSPRGVRAAMGAHFLTHIVPEVPPTDVRRKLDAEQKRGETPPLILVADTQGGEDVRDVLASAKGSDGVLLCLGSERGGLPDLGETVKRVSIKQVGFDSLNVAMAGTILLYELARSRGNRHT